jgi:hypothetical protein
LPSWKIVANNEFKILTSRFNKHRKALVIVLISFIIIYSGVISWFIPWFVNSVLVGTGLIEFLLAFLPTILIVAFMAIFIYSLVLPLSNTLQDIEKGQLEIIISSPIRPQQILFGIFLGRMFLYSLFIVIIGVPLISFLAALTTASPIFILISVGAIITLYLTGGWIGTMISATLQSRLSKMSKGRDIGRALTFVFSFLILIIFYSIFFFIQALQGSEIFNIIVQVLPSTWAANIVSGLILETTTLLSPLYSGLLIIAFSVLIIFLGYNYAEKIYSLEPPQIAVQTIKKENAFFKGIRTIFRGSLGTIVVTQMKDFVRRLENVSKIGYVLAITIVLTVVYSFALPPGYSDFLIFFIPLLFTQIITVLLGSDFTVKGKDKLWIYKKSPGGIDSLIISKVLQMIILILPIGIILMTITSVILKLSLINALFSVSITVFLGAVLSVLVVGIFSANPVFEERSSKFGLNMLLFMGIVWGGFMGIIFLGLFINAPFDLSLYLVSLTIYLICAVILVNYGRIKLSKLE